MSIHSRQYALDTRTFVEESVFCSTATVCSWAETSSIVLGRLQMSSVSFSGEKKWKTILFFNPWLERWIHDVFLVGFWRLKLKEGHLNFASWRQESRSVTNAEWQDVTVTFLYLPPPDSWKARWVPCRDSRATKVFGILVWLTSFIDVTCSQYRTIFIQWWATRQKNRRQRQVWRVKRYRKAWKVSSGRAQKREGGIQAEAHLVGETIGNITRCVYQCYFVSVALFWQLSGC